MSDDHAMITSREGLLSWVAAALKCSPEQIHENDSLIELGMSSLMMMRLPVMLKKAGVSIKLADLLKGATLANWFQLIEASRKNSCQEEIHQIDDQPFALTDMQRAYWLGRQTVFPLGGIAAHGYLEIQCTDTELNIQRLEKTLNQIIAAHPMLRMRLTPDGRQEILKEVPYYTIEYRKGPKETLTCRSQMQSEILPVETWPLFRIYLTGSDESPQKFLHISFDILVFDVASVALWLSEWHSLYKGIKVTPSIQKRHFSQYVAEIENKKGSNASENDKLWWNTHIATLPRAPQLPLAKHPREVTPPTILRKETVIEPTSWELLKKNTAKARVTPAALFATVLGETLSRFSRSPDMTLNLTLFDRSGERMAYDGVMGDFTSMLPVAVRTGSSESLHSLCQAVHTEICQALSHAEINGAEVSAEISRIQGFSNENPLPVVLTCAAGSEGLSYLDAASLFGPVVFARNQAPQTWIDVQVVDYQGGLSLVWDYVDNLFPEGVIDRLFALFIELLQDAISAASWHIPLSSLRQPQLASHSLELLPGAAQPLFAPFLENVAKTPAAPAVITPEQTFSYAELEHASDVLAHKLCVDGLVKKGDLVGIALMRGWKQIVAVLAVLRAGGAYLPINVDDPKDRIETILSEGHAAVILTEESVLPILPKAIHICVDEDLFKTEKIGEKIELEIDSKDVAYVIFTSGSTGKPKGVVVSHQAALNTIFDINSRNKVTSDDRLFGVSQLNFDLSVYDIFGTLTAGAALIVPPHTSLPEPATWLNLIKTTKATVWNSVPALAQLLVEEIMSSGTSLESLRLFLLSGDWLPVDLAKQILNLPQKPRLVSMGGATEAAIWSVEKVVENISPIQKNIPYGKPLSGQMLYVLDSLMRPCPIWVPGEIYIAGVGLAEGYLHQEDLTRNSFKKHPVTGERLYKTGDWGRWLPDGDIEFLGREDAQVKINGMRIELGEIEALIANCPGVIQAVAVVTGNSGNKKIVAFVLTDGSSQKDEHEIRNTLKQKLPAGWIPSEIYFESSLPLTSNGKIDRQKLVTKAKDTIQIYQKTKKVFLESESQQKIADIWGDILNTYPGVDVSFFDAGGTSFLALQLASRLTKALGKTVPVISLFQYTTIASQAKYLIDVEHPESIDMERGLTRIQKLNTLATHARNRRKP